MTVPIDLNAFPVIILVFGMEGCPACDAFVGPVFRKVAAKHPDIPAYAVDCNKQTEAADRFGITQTPTTLVIKKGRVTEKFEGGGNAADVERLFRMVSGRGTPGR